MEWQCLGRRVWAEPTPPPRGKGTDSQPTWGPRDSGRDVHTGRGARTRLRGTRRESAQRPGGRGAFLVALSVKRPRPSPSQLVRALASGAAPSPQDSARAACGAHLDLARCPHKLWLCPGAQSSNELSLRSSKGGRHCNPGEGLHS